MLYTASRCLIPAVIPLAKNTGHCEEVHLAAKNGSRKMTWRNSTIWPPCSSPQGKSKKRYETVVWQELEGKKQRDRRRSHLVQDLVASLLITIAVSWPCSYHQSVVVPKAIFLIVIGVFPFPMVIVSECCRMLVCFKTKKRDYAAFLSW